MKLLEPWHGHAARLGSYGAAFAIGVLLTVRTFPHWALIGGLPPGAPPRADFAQHVIGQLYFLSQPWDFSLPRLLLDRALGPPPGANIALTDSIPLLAILAKLARPLLPPVAPPVAQVITLYQAAAWVLQPVAAVFALRSAGERRIAPALGAAIMAASMPTFLYRLWHAALSGHFLLLAMLGLELRIVRGSRLALASACLLQVALLLVHPYLMAMASALLLAAPLTQFLRGDRDWRGTLLAVVLSTGLVLLSGQLLGYWVGGSDGGFGFYSMNLVAPFWPTFSALIPGVPLARADGTGGQAEGFQYLGLGLIGLLAISGFGWRLWREAARRQPGLLLACLALSLLAVSNWVFFMHARLLHIPFPARLLAQVRGSGRLFWPVCYALLIGSIVVVLRRFPRMGSAVVLAASLVQFTDAERLRGMAHRDLSIAIPFPFDSARLSAILRAHTRLTVLPTFPCNGGGLALNEDVLWLAAASRMRINSIYAARDVDAQDCLPSEAMGSRPAPGELRVLLPGFHQIQQALPDGARDCRLLAPYLLCTRQSKALAGLPPYTVPGVPASTDLPIRADAPGSKTLLAGWAPTQPQVTGTGSIARSAMLEARLTPQPGGAVRLRIHANAMPIPGRLWGRPWGIASARRAVSVWAGPRRIADWSIGAREADYDATVPAEWVAREGAVIVELRTGPLASTLDLGRTPDPRRFGIFLYSARFTPVAAR